MNAAHRQTLRDIMQLAWRKFRFERGAVSFSAALSHAWAWFKGAAAREAAAERYWAAPQRGTLYLRSTAQSPIRRSLTGARYSFDQRYRAGRLTSRLGA